MSQNQFVGKAYFVVIENAICSLQVKNPQSFVVSVCEKLVLWVASFRHQHLSEDTDVTATHLSGLFEAFVAMFESGDPNNVSLRKASEPNGDAVVSVTFRYMGIDHMVECDLHPCPANEKDGFVWKQMCDLYRVMETARAASGTGPRRRIRQNNTGGAEAPRKPKLCTGSTVRKATKMSPTRPETSPRNNDGGLVPPWKPVNTLRPNLMSRGGTQQQNLSGTFSGNATMSGTNGGGGNAASQQQSLVKHQWPSVLVDSRQALQRQLLQTQLEVIRLQSQIAALIPNDLEEQAEEQHANHHAAYSNNNNNNNTVGAGVVGGGITTTASEQLPQIAPKSRRIVASTKEKEKEKDSTLRTSVSGNSATRTSQQPSARTSQDLLLGSSGEEDQGNAGTDPE